MQVGFTTLHGNSNSPSITRLTFNFLLEGTYASRRDALREHDNTVHACDRWKPARIRAGEGGIATYTGPSFPFPSPSLKLLLGLERTPAKRSFTLSLNLSLVRPFVKFPLVHTRPFPSTYVDVLMLLLILLPNPDPSSALKGDDFLP